MVTVTTKLASSWAISKPSGPTERMVCLSLRCGPLPTISTARLSWRTTLLVKYFRLYRNDGCSILIGVGTKEGLKVEVITSLLPSINEKGAKVNATYKQPNVHTVATLDVFKVAHLNC